MNVEEIKKEFDRLYTLIDTLARITKEGFDRIEKRLDRVEERLDIIENIRLAGLERRMDILEDSMKVVKNRLGLA